MKYLVKTEHAVILDHIKEETKADKQLQKLKERIQNGDWEIHRNDPDVAPFYQIKHELNVVKYVIFRLNQIVIPSRLQRKAARSAHVKNQNNAQGPILVSKNE